MTIWQNCLAVFGLALAIASFASPGSAEVAISPQRAAAINECCLIAHKVPGYGDIISQISLYRTCMARHGEKE